MIQKDIVETYKAHGMYLDFAYGLDEYEENPSVVALERERHQKRYGFSSCILVRKKMLTFKDNHLVKTKILWEREDY